MSAVFYFVGALTLFVNCFSVGVDAQGNTIIGWTSPPGLSPTNVNGNATTQTFSESDTTAVTTTITVTGQTAPVAYSIVSQTVYGQFVLNSSSGVLTLSPGRILDYETTTWSTVVVQAVEQLSNTATATLHIHVTDVNDNNPVFSPTSYSATVADAAVIGTSVITVTATDADGTSPNNAITYTIKPPSNFAISPAGVITSGSVLSRAATSSCYSLTVYATDGGSPALTGTAMVDVCIGTSA